MPETIRPESVWVDRFRRLLMTLRAPWYFATRQSYRQALVKGMLRGEVLVRSGVRRVTAPTREDETLRLVVRRGAPKVNLVVPTIAFDLRRTPKSHQACALIGALADLGLDFRVIAVEESSFPHEARVRAWLDGQGVMAASNQARVEILDGTGPFVPVGADDVFVVVGDRGHAVLLQERLAGRAAVNDAIYLVGPAASPAAGPGAQGLALAPDASRSDARAALAAIVEGASCQARQEFAHRSRLGLGYEVLKPLAADHAPGRTCLFVHFDPDGRIDPHVLRYLSALRGCGLDIVLISSGRLGREAFAAAEPLTVAAINRQNKGLDFSAWALALELYPQLLQSQSLLIANDSVYGPVGDLAALFQRMDSQPLDVWGALESRDIDRHFQSWFVNFGRAALQSETFRTFWSGVLPLDDKRAVIHQYEVPLWRTFEAAGLRVGAAVNCDTRRAHDNPALDGWRALLRMGLPFVKVQLLRDNPSQSTSLDGWARELRQYGYPAELVVDHLYRVRGPEAAAFKDG
jgi:hypothetical protein